MQGHGGHRVNAGRPLGSEDSGPRMTSVQFATRLERLRNAGVMRGTSAAVLYAIMDSEYWLKVLDELEKADDWRTISELLKFHQQMRDGRPAQQINVTSLGVNFNTDEIAKVRAIVRELSPQAITTSNPHSPDAAAPTVVGTSSKLLTNSENSSEQERMDGEHALTEARGKKGG